MDKCFDCGVELEEINYGMPNYKPRIYQPFDHRPPLCKACWDIEILMRDKGE